MQKLESQLHLSKQFILLLTAMLLGSLAIACYLSFSLSIKIALISGILIYSVYILNEQLKWQAIRHNENGWWVRHSGEDLSVEIAGDSTVTQYVSVLRLVIPGKRLKQACVIFRDAMPKDTYRQLVVRLRNMR